MIELPRRAALAAGAFGLAATALPAERVHGQQLPSALPGSDDPALDGEIDGIDEPAIGAQLAEEGKAIPILTGADKARLARLVVEVAGRHVGKTEGRNFGDVEGYLNLWRGAHPWPRRTEGGRLHKFCAAGLGWVFCEAGREIDPDPQPLEPGRDRPTLGVLRPYVPQVSRRVAHIVPLCRDIVAVAKRRALEDGAAQWVGFDEVDGGTVQPKPGWLVLFSWPPPGRRRGDGTANHVGVVVAARDGGVSTIEFNTSFDDAEQERQRDGGGVARKLRLYRTQRSDGSVAEPVLGFVRWY